MTSPSDDDPTSRDLVEVAGVWWPHQLLERASVETLEMLAKTLANDGACRMCDAELGERPWVAMVDAAAGPFGAWAASGGVAHPGCAASESVWSTVGDREHPVPTSRCGAGVQPFPIPESAEGWDEGPLPATEQIPFPILSLAPAIDTFLIGVDPRGTRVEDKIMRRFHDLGWHRLRRGALSAVDMRPPQAWITLKGNVVTLHLADGASWDFEMEDPSTVQSFGCAAVLIGVTSCDDERVVEPWLFPGALYAVVPLEQP